MQAFRLIYRSIGCNIPRYSLQQQQSLQSNLQKRRERGRNRRGSLSRTRGGGNHFTTYFSLRLIFIFLPVWKEKGVGARWSSTRVRVATNPLPSSSSSSSKVYPGIDRRVEGKKKERGEERKRDKEEALLIGDALILGKAARLYRGWANIGVPCDGQGGSKIREEKEWRGKEWGEGEKGRRGE